MKRTGLKRKTPLRAKATRKKKGSDPAYLEMVRREPCCGCGKAGPSHAHHQHGEPGTLKGMGLKAPDSTAVPLCAGCHNAYHATGKLPFDQSKAGTVLRFVMERSRLLSFRGKIDG